MLSLSPVFLFLHYDKARWLFRLLSHPITPFILHYFLGPKKSYSPPDKLAPFPLMSYSSCTRRLLLEEEELTEYMRNDWSSGREKRKEFHCAKEFLPPHTHTTLQTFYLSSSSSSFSITNFITLTHKPYHIQAPITQRHTHTRLNAPKTLTRAEIAHPAMNELLLPAHMHTVG